MRSKIIFGIPIVAIFIVGAAATLPSAVAATADACSLVTAEQVSTVLGISMGAGSYVLPQHLETCTWVPSGASAKEIKSVTLLLETANFYEAGKRQMEQALALAKAGNKENANQMATQSVSGVGDGAFYLNFGNMTSLWVKKGNVAFKLSIYAEMPIEKKQAMEKTLALQVVSKL